MQAQQQVIQVDESGWYARNLSLVLRKGFDLVIGVHDDLAQGFQRLSIRPVHHDIEDGFFCVGEGFRQRGLLPVAFGGDIAAG